MVTETEKHQLFETQTRHPWSKLFHLPGFGTSPTPNPQSRNIQNSRGTNIGLSHNKIY